MRAYIVPTGCRTIDGLRRVERPDPRPRAGQVLVRIRAASLNSRDQAIVSGTYFGRPVDARHHSAVGRCGRSDRGRRRRHRVQTRRPRRRDVRADAARGSAVRRAGAAWVAARRHARRTDRGVRRRPRRHSAGPFLRGGGVPAVRGGHGVERADGGRHARQSRRHGAGARHRRRVDVRAAVCRGRRRAGRSSHRRATTNSRGSAISRPSGSSAPTGCSARSTTSGRPTGTKR